MSGVMAGTTILKATESKDYLDIVTLTINNSCNLSCPHCYLQYDGQNQLVDKTTIDTIIESGCSHISLVGKEPFANSSAIKVVQNIAVRASEAGKSISLITNGLNAKLAPEELIQKLAWIDLSLDGGERTYQSYRRGSWFKLLSSVEWLQKCGLKDLRVLQTLSSETASFVDDMVKSSRQLGASTIMFSPYRPTLIGKAQVGEALAPMEILDLIEPHADAEDIRLSFDDDYLALFGDVSNALARGDKLLGSRFSHINGDPIDRGIIRVTYDGLALTPLQAINTEKYHTLGRKLADIPLDAMFAALYAINQGARIH